jgi:multifunctional beta-oxidation protein
VSLLPSYLSDYSIEVDGTRYAHFFASRGSSVVVNDVSAQAAQAVVDEIKKGEYTASSIPAD